MSDYDPFYTKTRYLIMRCMLSNNVYDRIKYGKMVLGRLEKEKEGINSLIERLAKAGETILDQREWEECLYTAMGNVKDDVMYAAVTAKKVLDKRKDRKDEFR